jgi:hypothetical protein
VTASVIPSEDKPCCCAKETVDITVEEAKPVI